jgi:hypothetical protein
LLSQKANALALTGGRGDDAGMKFLRRSRRLLWVLSPALLAALLWVWTRPPPPPPEVDAPTADALEAAARGWPVGDHPYSIPKEDWPPELRRLRPLDVRVMLSGVYILLTASPGSGQGLFILREGSDFRPEQQIGYRLVRGRVYKFSL